MRLRRTTPQCTYGCFWEGCALPNPPAGGGMGKPGFPIPLLRGAMFTLGRAMAPPGSFAYSLSAGNNQHAGSCSHPGYDTRLGTRASCPRRVSAGKLPALPGAI